MCSKKNSKLFEKLRKVPSATVKTYRPDQSKPPRNLGTPPQKIDSRVGAHPMPKLDESKFAPQRKFDFKNAVRINLKKK